MKGFPDEIEDIDEQWDKSGYSPEAMISDAYKVDTVTESIFALDDIAGQSGSTRPEIVLQAWTDPDDDPQCKGEDGWSRAANDLYESGILLFQGAGNFGGTSTNCKVGSPGSAIGAFTVGGHSATQCPASITENNVRTGGPWPPGICGGGSSWGGNATEGKGRTIVDISGYACRQEMFTKSGTAEFEAFGDYNDAACGTSYSVATVSGAAADFIEYFNTKVHSTLLDNNPGLLFANMLLLADRGTAGGSFRTSEFDNRLGAGCACASFGTPLIATTHSRLLPGQSAFHTTPWLLLDR